ncbi:MAG: ATP-binding cassette domain-containing protein [Chloroflexi bacterium]|nr:ATP-binding cassette domain-containing protein [Chloroflexota bacterium]
MAEILINLDKVSVSLAGHPIFHDLSWEIQMKQRVGLVGPNGAGKSTLMRLIAAELPADSGNIFRLSGLTWGRLEQEPALEQTLDEFVGTLLIISHDRYFLDQTVDRIVELREGQLTEFSGGFTDYLAAVS